MSSGRYRIQAVSKMTGISTATLRSWERRYGVPSPSRTSSSYRLYGDADVTLLERMRDLCRDGMSPAEAAEVVKAGYLQPAAPTAQGEDPFAVARDRLVAAARHLDPQGIESELRRTLLLGPAALVFDEVLVPALRTVGQLWHDGELGVEHEHLFSEAVVRFAREALNLIQPSAGASQAVLACFEDEQHSLPLYLVGFRFAQLGYRTVLLGARTPPAALAGAVRELKPDLVGLSVSIPPAPARGEELVRGYAEAVAGTAWLVGGSGVNGMRGLIEEAGGVVASEDLDELRRAIKSATGASRKRRSK